MNVLFQIGIGTGLLVCCAVLHITLAAMLVAHLKGKRAIQNLHCQWDVAKLVLTVFGAFALSHTIHIYLWAFVVWLAGALSGYEEPFYFVLVTYTTLGYGDVTLAPAFRILGAMASVTGILMFGLTTAFLVSVFARALGAGSA